jgi:predicted SAM-dependent methyltransferase
MLDLLCPVARRVPPLRWLYRRYRGAPAPAGPRLQGAIPHRLNFGCGQDKLPGYLNVDIDPACQPDLLIRNGDTSAIPRDHFEDVYANDVLEHFPRGQTLGVLLDWASWLKVGGTLRCQTSSIIDLADLFRRSTTFEAHHGLTKCLFGNQAQEGDFHYTGFTEVTLRTQLLAAEFEVQEMALRDGWLFAVRAIKTKAWDGYIAALAGQSDEAFVRETFHRAVDEEPPAAALTSYVGRLKAQSATRWQIAKEVFSSEHRLWTIVARHSL